MHKNFNKRLVIEDTSGISCETSYVEDSSELQDSFDEHASFRKKVLRDPNFFKQLTLSFYSKKDSPVEPSPRIIQKLPEAEVQRTPTPKENNHAQIAATKQPQNSFLSPSQKQKSPNFAILQQQGLDKGRRGTPNNAPNENSTNENFNPNNRQRMAVSPNFGEKNSNQSSKQVTPKTFKISTVSGFDTKRALFQIPSPVLKREIGKSKSPVAKADRSVVPSYNGKVSSALSSGTVSVVPSTGATTPKYMESFVNGSAHQSEREKLQQAKTLKMPATKSQLKIKIPGQEEVVPMHSNVVKNLVNQSVKNGKITSPVAFKNYETPVGSKTVMSKQYISPSRPITPGMGNGHQFRAARILFQKENKAPENEQQQEKLFEKYFERTEAVDSRINTIKKRKI